MRRIGFAKTRRFLCVDEHQLSASLEDGGPPPAGPPPHEPGAGMGAAIPETGPPATPPSGTPSTTNRPLPIAGP